MISIKTTTMAEYRPLTVEFALRTSEEAAKKGYVEMAEMFGNIANKIAAFNERNPITIEEVRQRLGEEEFWALWDRIQEQREE
jgi:hypothetical protein